MQNIKRNMLSEQYDNPSCKSKTKEMSYNRALSIIAVGLVVNIISSLVITSWSNNRVLPVDLEKKAEKTELKTVENNLNAKIDTKVDKTDLDRFLQLYDQKNNVFYQKIDDRLNRMETRMDNFYSMKNNKVASYQ